MIPGVYKHILKALLILLHATVPVYALLYRAANRNTFAKAEVQLAAYLISAQ